jgi:hypothetical protein
MSAICALGFLLLDKMITASRSILLYATKLFLFFSIPTMYSPYLFILYGGAILLAITVYVTLTKRRASAFAGF